MWQSAICPARQQLITVFCRRLRTCLFGQWWLTPHRLPYWRFYVSGAALTFCVSYCLYWCETSDSLIPKVAAKLWLDGSALIGKPQGSSLDTPRIYQPLLNCYAMPMTTNTVDEICITCNTAKYMQQNKDRQYTIINLQLGLSQFIASTATVAYEY